MEILTVLAIMAMVLTIGLKALSRYYRNQRAQRAAEIFLNDFRYAQFLASQESEPTVVELIGEWRVWQTPDTPDSRYPYLEDIYRVWRWRDFAIYLGKRYVDGCYHSQIHFSGGTPETYFPAPFLVYSVPPADPSHPLNLNCGDDDLANFAVSEVPLPVFEVVPQDYVEPPTLAGNANWRYVRGLPHFRRRYRLPRDVDLVVPTPAPDPDRRRLSWWALVIYPDGSTRAIALETNDYDALDMGKPSETEVSTGVFHVGFVVRKESALRQGLRDVRRYCASSGMAKAVEILLAASDARIVDSQPARYAVSPVNPDSCEKDWSLWR